MNAVIKLLRNLAEHFFNASVTTFSYWSSAVLFIALMCRGKTIKDTAYQQLELFCYTKLC